MAFWKQLLLAVILVVVGLCSWTWFDPSAGAKLTSWGVPSPIVAVLPKPAAPAEQANASAAGQQAPNGQRAAGQGQAANNKQGGAGQGNAPGGGRRDGQQGPLVVVKQVVNGVVNDRLNAIGDGEAIQSVVVMPQAAGTIEEILVSSGQRVTKGTVLARLDDDEQVIARDQAQVMLRSAREKSDSYKNLASFSRLEVLDAQIGVETAQLDLTNAELNLKRRAIVAPIDGIVGIVAVNIGDNATTSTNVVSIDNRSELLVDFWAPERFATAVQPGMPVEASSVARPGQTFAGSVEAVDNRVDQASRTIRIRARIPNADDTLRAGMSFGVSMRFPGETYPSVDPLAIQWDSEGSYVWQVADGKSSKTRVRIIQRNPDFVLVDAKLSEGDQVVIEGLQRVREGGAVRVAGATKPAEVVTQ
ncbi:efflux RND transporter periplasmic adaptor subunit [Rhizobium sp. RU36D]|uniref:efflux RND transporter periplasmic adaptor subunit n=1 Tax=Rhizobium sp. RU36D TaxID=1907415 RepID=UPI0009D808F9|nr:efflux RND transporter periplasmic adaptor subunit [Rhizobium sp. RU36D]SMC58454.1 RND family efflux transporter, MFP subunit [Rhizobium sp. RU36D]